jgi:hypothetical protein
MSAARRDPLGIAPKAFGYRSGTLGSSVSFGATFLIKAKKGDGRV